jgi:hypothetical protein
MLSKDSPADLALQARQIAKSGMPPMAAWGELSSWASGKGPVALRSAAMEFISVYGRTPEAQRIMPEVMRSSSGFAPLPPRPSIFEFRSPVKPELRMPKPGLNFEPKFTAKAPLEKIQIKTALELPKRISEHVHFDSSKSPDTFSAGSGHNIIHSLIHKMRGHAAEHIPHLGVPAKKASSSKKSARKQVSTVKKLIRKKKPAKAKVKRAKSRKSRRK